MQLLMPKLGLTMTQAVLTRWLKAEGEAVGQGEILFEFESEKATMEYEAPAAGRLARILTPAGETVLCGTPVAVWESAAEAPPQGRADAPAQDGSAPSNTAPRFTATPAARRRARELSVDLEQVVGRGPGGRIQAVDVAEIRAAPRPSPTLDRPAEATPLARRLAAELGLDLGLAPRSGPGGRITRADVLAAARRQLALPPAPLPPSASSAGSLYASAEPLQGLRGVIARRMSESAFTAPHVTLHTEADATALAEARRQINAEMAGETKISYNTLLAALSARALAEHPALNACLIEGEIRRYAGIHIALAVDTERGLLVPVIRDADVLDLVAIQRTSDELLQRALTGRSLPDDLNGGTFTITNLGMYDIDGFTPIINQPQAAILGVGRIASKPVDAGGKIELRQMLTLSLSFDHRLVDGAGAARFLQRVKQLIERPFILLLPTRL